MICGTRSLPICPPTQIFCSMLIAIMVATNSFSMVVVGVGGGLLICACGVTDALMVMLVGVFIGKAVFSAVSMGRAVLQLDVINATITNQTYKRNINFSNIHMLKLFNTA
jgi:hypothetical protein